RRPPAPLRREPRIARGSGRRDVVQGGGDHRGSARRLREHPPHHREVDREREGRGRPARDPGARPARDPLRGGSVSAVTDHFPVDDLTLSSMVAQVRSGAPESADAMARALMHRVESAVERSPQDSQAAIRSATDAVRAADRTIRPAIRRLHLHLLLPALFGRERVSREIARASTAVAVAVAGVAHRAIPLTDLAAETAEGATREIEGALLLLDRGTRVLREEDGAQVPVHTLEQGGRRLSVQASARRRGLEQVRCLRESPTLFAGELTAAETALSDTAANIGASHVVSQVRADLRRCRRRPPLATLTRKVLP